MSAAEGRGAIYRGAFNAVLLQWSLRVIGLVSVLILARLLTPEDFGLIGIAVAALSLVELLGFVGLRQALLRIPEPTRAHLDTAWTIQLILFSAMGLIAIALAPLIARFYEHPELMAVVAALSVRFFFLGLINVGVVDFERHLDFGRDMRMRLSARAASLFVTVAGAFLLRNYWALVIGLTSYPAFHAIASFVAHPYRPRLSLARRAELLGVSLWMFATSVAHTVQLQVERLVLGRFGSAHLVGLYSVSKDLAEIFTQEIAVALNRVTFVTVARSPESLRGDPVTAGRLLGAYTMIAAPFAFGLAATAEDSVRVLLGEQWTSAAPLLQIVAVYSGFYAVYKVIASSLQAAGEAKLAALLSGAGALLLTVLVLAAALAGGGAIEIAWAAFAGNLLILAAGTAVMARLSGRSAIALTAHIARPMVAAGLMLLAVRLFGPQTGWAILDLAAAVLIGAAAFPAFLLVIWALCGRPDGAESEALSVARGLRLRLRPAPERS